MNKKPFVSVVVPNYNHAIFIEKRLDSILSQTYTNFEIIILDDCSTDNSLEIINRYKNDTRVSSVIPNETNSGSPFAQWKKGLKLCKGDLVWIAESDDACVNTFLEELVDFIQDSNLVMAFSLSRKMDSDGILGEIIQRNISHNIIMKGSDYISKNISLITNASSCIFSRACALKMDNNYYDYKGTGDWLFWAGIASQGKVGVLARPLNHYRVHESSTTTKMFSNGRDFFELYSVFKYLHEEKYWDWWNYVESCTRMLYSIKYVYRFDDETIRKNLLITWRETSSICQFLCLILRCRFHFVDTMARVFRAL